MVPEDIERRVDELRDIISRSKYAYYNEDAPFLSDSEYDKLEEELYGLNARYPELRMADAPESWVGCKIPSQFKPYKRKFQEADHGEVRAPQDDGRQAAPPGV